MRYSLAPDFCLYSKNICEKSTSCALRKKQDLFILIYSLCLHLILVLSSFAPAMLIGMIFFYESSELMGFILGLINFLILFFLGDKIILATVWAKKPVAQLSLELMIKNLKCRTGLARVQILTSDLLDERILVLDTWTGSKTVVIGTKTIEYLQPIQLQAVLHQIFFELKYFEWRFRTLVTILFLPFTLIILIGEKISKNQNFIRLLKFFLLPIFTLRAFFFKFEPQLRKRGELQSPQSYAYDLRAAKARLACLEGKNEHIHVNELCDPLCYNKSKKTSILTPFFEKKMSLDLNNG